MKLRAILICLLFLLAVCCYAQTIVEPIRGTVTPSFLSIEVHLSGFIAENLLEAGQSGEVALIISNPTETTAQDVKIRLAPEGNVSGISFDSLNFVGELLPGSAKRVVFRVAAADTAKSGLVRMQFEISGLPRSVMTIRPWEFSTREFRAPHLVLIGKGIKKEGEPPQPFGASTRIDRHDTVQFVMRVRNIGKGNAEGVSLNVSLKEDGQHAFYVSTFHSLLVYDLPPDSSDQVAFRICVEDDYPTDSIHVAMTLTERRPQFSVDTTFTFPLSRGPSSFARWMSGMLQSGLNDSVIMLCRQTIKLCPDSSLPYFYLGKAYENQNDVENALRYFQEGARRGDTTSQEWMEKNTHRREVLKVNYGVREPDPFKGYTAPIGVGILVFSSPKGGVADLTQRLYDALKSSKKVRNQYELYSYAALEEQKKGMGLNSLDPGEGRVLNSLNAELSVKFVVTGVVNDERIHAFTARIIRTSDGACVLKVEFQDSENSTGLLDAVKLFETHKIPEYKTEHVLEVRR
jgi:hypothetical protein